MGVAALRNLCVEIQSNGPKSRRRGVLSFVNEGELQNLVVALSEVKAAVKRPDFQSCLGRNRRLSLSVTVSGESEMKVANQIICKLLQTYGQAYTYMPS